MWKARQCPSTCHWISESIKNWSAKALASIVILRIPCLIINDKSVLVKDGVLSVWTLFPLVVQFGVNYGPWAGVQGGRNGSLGNTGDRLLSQTCPLVLQRPRRAFLSMETEAEGSNGPCLTTVLAALCSDLPRTLWQWMDTAYSQLWLRLHSVLTGTDAVAWLERN